MKSLFLFLIAFLPLCGVMSQAREDSTAREAIANGKVLNPGAAVNLPEVDTFSLDIVPPSSGVSFLNGDIVFLSLSKNEQKMTSSQISFGNIQAYTAGIQDTATGKHRAFSPFSSTPFSFPTDALTFSKDGNTMYFTAVSKTDGREKIYEAQRYSSGTRYGWSWGDTPLDFCTDTFRYTHPALSGDGNLLVFASDKAGATGGMDLFQSRKTNSGWSSPENLGDRFNSKGNEMFPFLDMVNDLYFSSDGMGGRGGYDIFVCRYTGEGWEKPANLSSRINTAADDIAFTMDCTGDTLAFYTVRQLSGNKEMQLHVIKAGFADTSGTREGLTSALLTIAGQGGERIAATVPQETGAGDVSQPDSSKRVANVKPEDKSAKTAGAIRQGPKNTGTKNPPATSRNPANTGAKPTGKPSGTNIQANDTPVYRVQFASSSRPKGSYQITVDGNPMKTWEYNYKGIYRECVGEYSTLAPAKKLQSACRKSGFPQAFVVVFVNGERTVEAKYFR